MIKFATTTCGACIVALGLLHPAALRANVTNYHNDTGRGGMFVVPDLTSASAATLTRDADFAGLVNGASRAQLLYWTNPANRQGELLAATNNNEIVALDPVKGTVIWSRNLGPVPAPQSGKCTSGLTTGVLGTPVLDGVAGVMYLDSFMVSPSTGQPAHLVWAIALADGSTVPGWPVDVQAQLAGMGQTFNALREGERSALALIGGQIYVPYGSNTGECSDFRGWVTQIDPASAKVVAAWATRASKGGIWSQGGVITDGASAFVATGNTGGTNVWGDGEAVIRVQPGLAHSTDPKDFFAPVNWHQLDLDDLDMGGTSPVPINVPKAAGGTAQWLFQIGKAGIAYILDRNNLGGLGGGLARLQVASPEVATAPAVYTAPDGSGTYVSFIGNPTSCPVPIGGPGLITLKVQARPSPSITTAWCDAVTAQGTPIVTTLNGLDNPIVWVEGARGDGYMHAYDGVTGKSVFTASTPAATPAGHMNNTRRWDAIIWAHDSFYVGGTNHVFRFTYTPNK